LNAELRVFSAAVEELIMGRFLEQEKIRLANFKRESRYFSDAAQANGVYKKKERPFCLPEECSEENLFAEIRRPCLEYFTAKEIKWHDALSRRPSNHLCDSQVCCVNFLFPFANEPEALAALLRRVFPGLMRMLPMEDDDYFVAFEWIGQQNYLRERLPHHGKRTRGANFTSADAAVRFECEDGKKQIALIEWKYTESYSSSSYKIARSGTDRTAIYQHLYARQDFPLSRTLLPDFGALFYEPFYQLFRQQALANEMEIARELGADIVSVLHIAPAQNTDFLRVTSPELRGLGQSALEVWKELVKQQGRFSSVTTERLFGSFASNAHPGLRSWWDYIAARYPWILSD
jgi:hypothetical protein